MGTYEKIFDFLTDPTKENFLACRKIVINDPDYDPYSKDLDKMEDLLNNGEFQKVREYVNINILLSPRAHIYKFFAYKELGDEKASQMEMIIAQTIFECIEKTGNGTKDSPYIVTYISDEMDLIKYHLDKNYTAQRLIKPEDQVMDVLTLDDGTDLYFDIKIPYERISFSYMKRQEEESKNEKEVPKKKKWWKF